MSPADKEPTDMFSPDASAVDWLAPGRCSNAALRLDKLEWLSRGSRGRGEFFFAALTRSRQPLYRPSVLRRIGRPRRTEISVL